MNARVWKVAPLLFVSGLCALVYQTAWLRELRLIFGASTAASAAVLAIFMGGLGLGSALLGSRADRHPRPLALYAQLEVLIALAAGLTPMLVWVTRHAYVLLGGTEVLGLWGGTAVRLVLSALVLAVPTVLMGGTLPAAARAVEHASDGQRRALGVLYGVNTLGAVTGAAASTFVLVEALGTRTTLWVACLLNLLIAVVARAVARHLDGRGAAPRPQEAAEAASLAQEEAPADAEAPVEAAPGPRASPRFVLLAAAIVGMAFLLMELVWYRMLAPILGGSTFTFGLVLVTALLGMGLGGAAYVPLFRDRRATLGLFALTCALEAAFMAVPLALGDGLANLALLLRSLQALGFGGLVLCWSALTAIVVFPASLIAGVQYPLLIALLGRGSKDVGRQVGQAYAWNTLGSIVGSLAGGFGLMPLLTAPGTWRLVVLVLAVLAVAALVLGARAGEPRRSWPAAALAVALALMFASAPGPTAAWRHSGIGAGRAQAASTRTGQVAEDRARRQALVWEAEGVESSVALMRGHGLAFFVNGKSDGNMLGDAATQVMSGLVGTLLHPAPRHALVVGLGTGSTAGWMAQVQGMERVDVVEIEPAIVEVARRGADVNARALDNPRVRLLLGDAREVLLATRERYDVIFSEPSNPYRAGIASLFTREFYRAARERLNEGGMFVQWVQAYEVDAATVESVYVTLGAEFPHISTWMTKQGDMLLVATATPVPLDARVLRERIEQEPYRTALRAIWRTRELEGVLAHHLAGPGFARRAASLSTAPANTDDHNRIEFGFARSVGRSTSFSMLELTNLARALGLDRPEPLSGTVDWVRLEEQRLLITPGLARHPALDAQQWAAVTERARLLRQLLSAPQQAVERWRAKPFEPRDYGELGLLAVALVNTRAPEAERALQQLAAFSPTEAMLLRAPLALGSGQVAEAARLLEQGFEAMRTDPWVGQPMAGPAFSAAMAVARQDHALGRRLFEVLERPFSVLAFDESRRNTRLALADAVDRAGLCVQALEEQEPHTPWALASLEWRAGCYAAADHPRFELAYAELERFRAEMTPGLLPPLKNEALERRAPGGAADASGAQPPVPSAPATGQTSAASSPP